MSAGFNSSGPQGPRELSGEEKDTAIGLKTGHPRPDQIILTWTDTRSIDALPPHCRAQLITGLRQCVAMHIGPPGIGDMRFVNALKSLLIACGLAVNSRIVTPQSQDALSSVARDPSMSERYRLQSHLDYYRAAVDQDILAKMEASMTLLQLYDYLGLDNLR